MKRRWKVDADKPRMLGPALSKPTLISLTPDLADIPTLLGKAELHEPSEAFTTQLEVLFPHTTAAAGCSFSCGM